jgi:hypothetical protein
MCSMCILMLPTFNTIKNTEQNIDMHINTRVHYTVIAFEWKKQGWEHNRRRELLILVIVLYMRSAQRSFREGEIT